MRTATSIQREASTLTPAQEAEMRRMDPNGDGIIDEKEGRAIARSSAKLRASNMKYKKGLGSAPGARLAVTVGHGQSQTVAVGAAQQQPVAVPRYQYYG